MSDNKKLANPQGMRSFSDRLDAKVGWEGGYKETSGTRGFIHGVWHTGAGIATFNGKEFSRAGEQFSKMWETPKQPPAK